MERMEWDTPAGIQESRGNVCERPHGGANRHTRFSDSLPGRFNRHGWNGRKTRIQRSSSLVRGISCPIYHGTGWRTVGAGLYVVETCAAMSITVASLETVPVGVIDNREGAEPSNASHQARAW